MQTVSGSKGISQFYVNRAPLKSTKQRYKKKAKITKTDKEIDAMVYELYGLKVEEIAIIENN